MKKENNYFNIFILITSFIVILLSSCITRVVLSSKENIDANISINIETNEEHTAENNILAKKNGPVNIKEKNKNDMSITIEGIPILAWLGVEGNMIEKFLELKECGIDYNFVFHQNADELALSIDAAKEAGIKTLIHCYELSNGKKISKIVKRFKDNSSLVGYYLKDEPNSKEFPSLRKLVRKIQAIDKKHFCYINLFGLQYGTHEGGTIDGYRNYVQSFLAQVPVKVLSFDDYPIIANGSGRSLNPGWYQCLEIISEEAKKNGIPFWAFARTSAMPGFHEPQLEDLRLQVYSNLSYGAQGIQYFTYLTPWGYWMCPISASGEKTETWYIVQQMSKEIKALSRVFLGAKVLHVRHIATNNNGENEGIPVGTMRFDFAQRPKEANIIKTFSIPNSTNAMVSFLKNNNRCYMVIINCNLYGGNNVIFTITGGKGLELIKKDGTVVNASEINSSQLVTPGDALIYGWDIYDN
jgi:hypothetical protein